jgi:transcriptional regulator with XRE-family HTH domain
MDAGELLRSARRERGLDQAELARRSGTTQAYVSRVERGEVSPSLKTLERLLYAMGRRLNANVEPLTPGNVAVDQLRGDLAELTAVERVEQAMELSEFLTGVAVSASGKSARGSR